MEIIYLTDIHDDLKNLRVIIQNTRADMYVLSGDLIYKAFFTEDKLYHFLEVQEFFYSYIQKNEIKAAPYELAMDILDAPTNYPVKFRADAAEYRLLFQQAAVNMKEKYRTIRQLIEKYSNATTIVIPGNYDMDLQYTALHEYDLHRKHIEKDKIRFSGYGGAPIITPGIPEMLSVVYDEEHDAKINRSEPLDIFRRNKPDVLVIHNPAFGTLDRLASFGHCGSMGTREYIDDDMPCLALSGHVHEDYGLLKIGQTYCLNPGNFGGVESLSGYEAGGFFCRIRLERAVHKNADSVFLRNVILFRLVEGSSIPVLEIKIDRNLRAVEKVYDDVIFSQLGRFLR